MKRKVSMSFFLLFLCLLAYTPQIIGIFGTIASMFTGFNVTNIYADIVGIFYSLVPLALVLLLYFNRKSLKQPVVSAVLISCGLIHLLYSVYLAINFVKLFSISHTSEVPIIKQFCLLTVALLIGVTCLLTAYNVKKKDTTDVFKVLAGTALLLSIAPMAANVALGTSYFLADLGRVLLAAGLVTLPQTLFDYDHCFLMSSKRLITIICTIVCFVAFSFFGPSKSTSSSSNQERCFNCGGDGWDSYNNCTCVWCGGDGKTVWNP